MLDNLFHICFDFEHGVLINSEIRRKIIMAISEVIKFGGSPDDIVWKHSGEEFNATSQLIVDEVQEAILCVNGQATDLFGPGRHTLSVPNIPIARKLVNIPTGGTTPFPCKVFYINKVHQMDMLWGTRGSIDLDDPLYDIFLHIMLHGNLAYSIEDSRKFLIKLAGFRSRVTRTEVMEKFKGIVSSHVKDAISKIMINGLLSYFMINAHLFDISDVVKEKLDVIFSEYGIRIEYFNIESIDVPRDDYAVVAHAKEERAKRLIEGYTWKEEREMLILEKFAANEGTAGAVGGAMGGFMMGGVLGGSISDIARQALSGNSSGSSGMKNLSGIAPARNAVAQSAPVLNTAEFLRNGGVAASVVPAVPTSSPAPAEPFISSTRVSAPFDLSGFDSPSPAPLPVNPAGKSFCSNCGQENAPGSKFCCGCGMKLWSDPVCPSCGSKLSTGAKFCSNCGQKI